MSDLAIAGVLLAFFVSLAIAAPIWGVDSRDGIESDQSSRRVAWLHDRAAGQAARTGRTASATLAGALRTAAHRLDVEAGPVCSEPRRLAEVC